MDYHGPILRGDTIVLQYLHSRPQIGRALPHRVRRLQQQVLWHGFSADAAAAAAAGEAAIAANRGVPGLQHLGQFNFWGR